MFVHFKHSLRSNLGPSLPLLLPLLLAMKRTHQAHEDPSDTEEEAVTVARRLAVRSRVNDWEWFVKMYLGFIRMKVWGY
jgi:hypothetical protein